MTTQQTTQTTQTEPKHGDRKVDTTTGQEQEDMVLDVRTGHRHRRIPRANLFYGKTLSEKEVRLYDELDEETEDLICAIAAKKLITGKFTTCDSIDVIVAGYHCNLAFESKNKNGILNFGINDICRITTEEAYALDPIQKVVDKVIDTYMKEDYDHVVSMARAGQKVHTDVTTIQDEIEFIRNNGFDFGLDNKDLTVAAREIKKRIADIDNTVFKTYSK